MTNFTRRSLAFGGMGLLAGAAAARSSLAHDSFLGVGEGLEDFWLASDAYIFGYPLVTMEMTRRIMFVTGDVAGTEAERFLEETGTRWLAKPFRLKDLLRTARDMVA